MSNRFINPNPQFASATDVYSGGNLYFYLTGTSTPADTFTEPTLTPGNENSNPVPLNSAGRPTEEIFLDPNVTYKVILKDADGNTIWTRDPVVDHAANVSAAFTVYTGDPNGAVAGNEGTLGGSGASVIWDITNNLLYVCTTTGTALTAVWTQVGGQLSGAISFTSIISPVSLAADQNDYTPTGFSTAYHVRQDSSADVTITGWIAGTSGREFTYTNISAFKHTFADQSASSAAANRFELPFDMVIMPNESKEFWYDFTDGRWRVKSEYSQPFQEPGGRLTLTTATPVLTSDTTGITTIFYTPYKHSYARLFNGGWYTVRFTELSQTLADTTKSPAAAAPSTNYDMFLWNDAGTLRCTRGPAWSSATARGTGAGTTELELVDGVYLNKVAVTNGPIARRGLYVGTISTSATGVNGQLNMMFFPAAAAGGSANRLDVWNMYNRVSVSSSCRDSTNSWTYTTATWRSANNSTSNRITVVCGLNEDHADVTAMAVGMNSTGSILMRNGIGLDSTSAIVGYPGLFVSVVGVFGNTMTSRYLGLFGLGSHFVQQLEFSTATGTCTWYGDNNEPLNCQSGIMLHWMM